MNTAKFNGYPFTLHTSLPVERYSRDGEARIEIRASLIPPPPPNVLSFPHSSLSPDPAGDHGHSSLPF